MTRYEVREHEDVFAGPAFVVHRVADGHAVGYRRSRVEAEVYRRRLEFEAELEAALDGIAAASVVRPMAPRGLVDLARAGCAMLGWRYDAEVARRLARKGVG